MDYFIIIIVCLFGSFLTFYAGFGLGTLLLPVFNLFFPLEIAIMATAIVHFSNNLFKLGLTYSNIHRYTALQFGVASLIFAFIGAKINYYLGSSHSIAPVHIGNIILHPSYLKIVVGLLLIIFSLLEDRSLKMSFMDLKSPNFLRIGGAISGFFGGLSGHQGALRSMFLTKILQDKKVFVATGTFIACLVDISRIPVYLTSWNSITFQHFYPIAIGIVAAFVGAFIGNKYLQKIKIEMINLLITILLVAYGICLIIGLI